MAIDKINLRKLLQLLFSSDRKQRSLLLADIRQDVRRDDGLAGSGGDFYGPFWADVKDHIARRVDLSEQVAVRVAANKSRSRLYPLLRDDFLQMWGEKVRWRNEPFEFIPESVKAQLPIPSLLAVVKIENTAALKINDGTRRVIYPYFSEEPVLPEQGARIGFWVLQTALPNFRLEEFRIIDLQNRAYFRPSDIGMKGDEEKQFLQRYGALLERWRKLRNERK